MPRRITKAFFATAAAGATITAMGFAAAGPAGAAAAGKHTHFNPSAPQTATNANCTDPATDASTGTWTSTDCGKVGYVATGRTFRFASAIIKVPTFASANSTPAVTGEAAYVALDASATNPDYAQVGIMPDPDADGTWQMFYNVSEPCTGVTTGSVALAPNTAGDGVFVSVYQSADGSSVHLVATPPQGTPINTTVAVCNPIYTDAQAFADWTLAAENVLPSPAIPVENFRDTQFFQGRFTTTSGAQGTFKGPWTLTAVDATTNGGLPPSGTLIGQSSYLWNDGASFGGMGNDAFGVWRYANG